MRKTLKEEELPRKRPTNSLFFRISVEVEPMEAVEELRKEAREALRYMESGAHFGKICIKTA
jgi:hypothetical protein